MTEARLSKSRFFRTLSFPRVGIQPQGQWLPSHAWLRLAPLVALALSLLTLPVMAQEMAGPSLRASTQDGGAVGLPLIEESVRTVIDQGHATTRFAHTFQNETTEVLEGRYQIALGAVATATGFAYYNGEEKIVGEIFEKEAARQVYETVTGLGRDPGLLEQSGEGVFSFRVAPITSGEKKRVEVTTSQWLRESKNTIEYRVPVGRPQHTAEARILDTRKISKIWSPTHEISLERSERGAKVRVLRPRKTTGELILRYTVEQPDFHLSTAVHRSKGQDAYVVMSLASPPSAQSKRTPRDVTFVVDRSGSMSGAPLEAARRATEGVLKRLGDDDRVNVISFDDGVDALYERPRPVKDVRSDALAFVANIASGGGTDLALALAEAADRQEASGRTQVLLFLTDGQSDSQAALEAAKKAPPTLQLYSVGIGAGVDRALLSKLARDNRGRFTYVADEAHLEKDVDQLYSRIESPVLTDLQITVRGAQVHRLYPRLAPDLFENDQLTFAMRLRPNAKDEHATLVVKGKRDGKVQTFTKRIELSPSTRPWVGRQWGSARVDDLLEQMALSGETPELKRETIELALAYDLVTKYTSFLAIPASEITDAVRGTMEQERARRAAILKKHQDAAALSRTVMPPGDPVITVKAPLTSQGVTALFPFGLSLDLTYQPSREVWEGRFLVPNQVADGPYDVRIFVTDQEGVTAQTTTRYEIDSRAPAFSARTTAEIGGIQLVVEGDEPLRQVRVTLLGTGAALRLAGATCKSGGCSLEREGHERFRGLLELPPGTYRLRIVVTDDARNESVQVLTVVVPEPGEGC